MCKPSETKPPLPWSSLTEHVIKSSIYTLLAIHAVRSAIDSTTTVSRSINSVIALFAFFMIKGEVETSLKRILRKLPPGHLGYPIIREIQFVFALTRGGVQENLAIARKKFGALFIQSFIGRINVVAGGQEDLNFVFNNDRKALMEASWPPNIVMLLGPGAVANQVGQYHRTLRRLLEPYFAPKFVKNYLKIMDETTLSELDQWSSTGDYVSSEVFKAYALRLFYASGFGEIDEPVLKTLHDDFKLWLDGFMAMTTLQLPGTVIKEAMAARKRILDTVDQLIEKFQKENPEDSQRAQITIIGRLIYGKDKDNNRMMTRDEMKDNILLLIFAGHDTTYASISTLLYHLSQNEDAYKALSEDVATLKEPLDENELKNAPVLNACLHESWRLDPPVIGGFRKSVKPLEHKGYNFDKGTIFNYSVLMATTDESLYKNHEKFNFHRFLPKDHKLYKADQDCGIDPFQGRANYPIFGGGTHICLGKAFAQLELRVLAARMMKHYKVEVRNSKKVYFPVNGWNVEFKLTKKKEA